MSKDEFIEYIDNIEYQFEIDDKYITDLGHVFPNAFTANMMYDNHYILDSLIKLLAETLKDENGWIDWYIYETHFGKDTNVVKNENESETIIDSPSKLYDLIVIQ